MLRATGVGILAAMLIPHLARADSPSVTAVLRSSEISVGDVVKMDVKIQGTSRATAPEDISVDGLEIHRTGQSYESQLTFGFGGSQNNSSVVYTYSVYATKAGTFKIPPQSIAVGNNTLKTPELTLHVSDVAGSNTSQPRQNAPRQGTSDTSRIAFLEFVVPKRDGYVGEVLPVEIKLGLNSHVQFQGVEFPDFKAQGVTLQKADKPTEALETRNGVNYRVTTFKGALSAIRPGKLELPPIETTAVALLRQKTPDARRRSRSPFDIFNAPDPFDDPFFSDPFGAFQATPTKIAVRSESVALDIKPLPPNPPASFSGAVGNFAMNVEAKPKTVQVGDPITVTATVSGRGNFDRMSAPMLEDEHGWHKYPPSGKFKADDDVGISGSKTFEEVISPNEKKTNVPRLSFSYFDPLKESYVTLNSEPMPIQVEGNAIAAAQPTPAAVAAATAQPGSSTPATTKPQDILYQLNDWGRSQSFTPIYMRPIFWTSQIVPFLALLVFAGFRIRQNKIDNREARRTAALEQESSELVRKLRRRDLSPQEYFNDASRVVRVKTALAKNVDPNTVDLEMAQSAFELDENSREQLRRLFQRSDELRYSGATGNGSASPQDRESILHLIERLHV